MLNKQKNINLLIATASGILTVTPISFGFIDGKIEDPPCLLILLNDISQEPLGVSGQHVTSAFSNCISRCYLSFSHRISALMSFFVKCFQESPISSIFNSSFHPSTTKKMIHKISRPGTYLSRWMATPIIF